MFDPKLLRRKGKDRHMFLFEQALIFSKETKDNDGKVKYLYKYKLKVCPPHILVLQALYLNVLMIQKFYFYQQDLCCSLRKLKLYSKLLFFLVRRLS